MAITDYSTTRDSNASISPGDIRSNDYRRDQQIINAIRQLMADLAAMQSGGTNGIEKITIVRSGLEASQYFELGISDAGGHNIKGFSATNNAKLMIFETTTDSGNTAPSSGENGFRFRVRGTDFLAIDDSASAVEVRSGILFDLQSGQIKFPATQVPSTNANTLDDYEEGTWTPVVTFATPGDLSVVYSGQTGRYCKIGNRVVVTFSITTTTFTHTTASGECRITGLPFTSAGGASVPGALTNGNNITYPAGRTYVQFEVSNGVTYGRPIASGSGTSRSTLTPTEMPTTSTVVFLGSAVYEAAN